MNERTAADFPVFHFLSLFFVLTETDTAAVGPFACFTLLPSGRRQGAAGRRGMEEEPLELSRHNVSAQK